MLKWTLIFIPFFSFSQTVDTLSNAYAVRNTYENIPLTGILNNGHVYGMGMDMKFNANGTALPIQFTRIDFSTKQVLKTEITGTTSSVLGVIWRNVFDSTGRLIMGLNTANRKVFRFNLKGESVTYEDFGNGFYYNDGTLAYSIILNANRTMTLGGSSGPASTQMSILYENGYIKKLLEIDSEQDYTTQSFMDTGRYAYAQVGQDPFRLYAIDTLTGNKTLLTTRSDGFPVAFGNATNGIYARPSPVEPFSKLVNGAYVTIPPAPASAGRVEYTEVKIFSDDPSAKPLVTTFWDAEKSTLHYDINHVHDSVHLETDSIRDGINRALPSKKYIYYTAAYYGGMYRYDTLTQERVFLGNPQMNVYAMLQYNDSIIYLSGYGSGVLREYNINQPWTVNTYYNGSARPASATSNPKQIAYWHTYSEISHAVKLIKLPNGVIATMGGIIRTGNSANIAFYNPATQQAWGYGSDSMYLQSESDICAWQDKYVLFSTSDLNGGVPKIFIYDTELHKMVDSLNFGLKNYGNIFCVGDFLYGIAQDNTFTGVNAHLDSVTYYKVNLSTKKLTYLRRQRAQVKKALYMPDGYIGLRLTYTASGASSPVVIAPVPDWTLTRAIDDKVYYYNNNKSYITIGETLLQNRGITNTTIDLNTAQGKQQYLINWLR